MPVNEELIQQVMKLKGLNRADAKRKIAAEQAKQLMGGAPQGRMVGDRYVKPHDTERIAHLIRTLMGAKQQSDIRKEQTSADTERDAITDQYTRQMIEMLQGGQQQPQFTPSNQIGGPRAPGYGI